MRESSPSSLLEHKITLEEETHNSMRPEGNSIAASPSPTVQHPSDLAALVHSYLLAGVGRMYRGKDGLPSLQAVTELFEVLFHLSLQAEEGHQIVCAAAFMSPVQTSKSLFTIF
jgi:hypothetical protein